MGVGVGCGGSWGRGVRVNLNGRIEVFVEMQNEIRGVWVGRSGSGGGGGVRLGGCQGECEQRSEVFLKIQKKIGRGGGGGSGQGGQGGSEQRMKVFVKIKQNNRGVGRVGGGGSGRM